MPTTQVKIYSLAPYRHLFPKATVLDKTVKMGATVADTVDFIPMIVAKTRWQVERFVESELRGLSTYKACEKLWYFVKHHIRYKKDERGVEQVRSSRRLIHDGVGDCDCFTTFIDTCLAVLKIPTINRITKYGETYFQHIYPIVPIGNGNYIIMDCVVDKFNFEQPYTEKEDHKMDLQYLDGIDDDESISNLSGNIDAQDLLGLDGEIGDLGRKGNKANKGGVKKFFKKQKNMSASAQNDANSGGKKKKKFGQRLREGGRKVLHVANRVNPATVLLRAGILASMKLNILKVPEQLKWGYLTPEQAKAKGADMSKFGKLKKILQKIEGIFFATGGKPENLRKAMLTGRGNRHHEVAGLGMTDSYETQFEGNEYTPMQELLGTESYNSEFVDGLEGTEGLGVIATSAAIASASAVMGTIAALIKSVGSIFPKKSKTASDSDGGGDSGGGDGGSDDGGGNDSSGGGGNDNSGGGETNDNNSDANTEPENNTPTDDSGSANGSENSTDENSETPEDNTPATTDENSEAPEDNTPATTDQPSDEGVSGLSGAAVSIKAFWDNNKKWIKPVGIGLTVVGAIWLGYKHFSKEKKAAPQKKHKTQPSLNGVSKRKKRKRKGARKKSSGKKSHIALM